MGISIWQLLIVLAIVALLFGTKRLRNMGSDLGGAVKGFRNAMEDKDHKETTLEHSSPAKEEEKENNSRTS